MGNFEMFLEISYFIKGGIICKEIMFKGGGVTFSAIFKKIKVCEPYFFFPYHLLKTGFFLKSVVIFTSRNIFFSQNITYIKSSKLGYFKSLLLQLTYCFYVMYLKVHVDIKISKKLEVFPSICF
jgi:hypothetical protein